ncbi:MAG: hypothetical protein M3Z15_11265, partial [Pseudomonadota bacterium]|nr:hypothetical protein [Pseudomonadota bacterium]
MAGDADADGDARAFNVWSRVSRAVRAIAPRLHRFRPRLVDDLAGYDRHRFGADLGAGVTVGIVAL